MSTPELLLERLSAIAAALEDSGSARALIAFGSAGETERLDAFSDLDFLVIARDGEKARMVNNLAWLEKAAPLVYSYKHTADGFKALSKDGILCDFGIVEALELNRFPHGQGRVVWSEESFDPSSAAKNISAFPDLFSGHNVEWLTGEILTALFVGLCRHERGEKMSAFSLIQGLALERYLELIALPESPDPFDPLRRIEVRFPGIEKELAAIAAGYSRTIESAQALLEALSNKVTVPTALREMILARLSVWKTSAGSI